MDYTFQEDDDAARRKTLIGAVAFVLAIIIGIILVASAASKRRGKLGGSDADAAADSRAASGETADVRRDETKPVAKPQKGEAKKPTRQESAETAKSKPTGAPPPPDVRSLVEQGQEAERRDDLAAARKAYEEALASPKIGNARALVESRLGDVFVRLVMSQREMPEKIEHAIVSGDRISKLARKHGTTTELIASANKISNPNNIKLGDRIRILNGAKFEIRVSKSENWLLVTMNGKFFKRYTVGTGQYNRTPVGTFKITDKIKEPSWWKDNKEIPFGNAENILGTRWMALSATGSTPPAKGYGIHGTWDNSSLGQQSSAGCVRMSNDDVEELFTYIPEGTAVIIED